MSIINRVCSGLLILLLLFPAISSHDDAISISRFLSNDSPADDSLAAVRLFSMSDDDSLLATLLDRLETLHVGTVCSLHFDVSSTPFQLLESGETCNRSVAAPVGRAPPVV